MARLSGRITRAGEAIEVANEIARDEAIAAHRNNGGFISFGGDDNCEGAADGTCHRIDVIAKSDASDGKTMAILKTCRCSQKQTELAWEQRMKVVAMNNERRAPVQGELSFRVGQRGSADGSIEWAEHEKAGEPMQKKWGSSQAPNASLNVAGLGIARSLL